MDTSTQQTYAADAYLQHLLSIKNKFNVSRVSYIDGFSQEDVPVAIAYRPNSKVLSQSGGKGITRTQAAISALMESFECHTAEEASWDHEGSFNNLDGRRVDPRSLAVTMKDFDNSEINKWVKTERLRDNLKYWIPFDAISLDFQRMVDPYSRDTFFLSSNGLASGSSWSDAITSAIYEVIERHSLTVNELRGTDASHEIDLFSIQSDPIFSLLRRLQRHGLRCRLYQNTLWDIFPTYKAVILNDTTRWTGFGTHINYEVAILRALTEANQARLISISGTREDMNKEFYLSVYPNDQHHNSTRSKPKPLILQQHRALAVTTLDDLIRLTVETTQTQWYVYKYEQIDRQVFVVRVIAENLHGYNYPGYPQCTALQHNIPTLNSDTRIRNDQHSPAAG